MSRSRAVLSFMSQFGGPPKSPTSSSPPMNSPQAAPMSAQNFSSPPMSEATIAARNRVDRPPSRPASMLQSYHPPLMEVAQDTPPELQPIFTFLNSHSNKLFQEGYFLKLNDLDSNGRPNPDRTWTECFAQLVGTVLSLWDAAALDAAGQDGEVVPTFINLTDASVKMIETLPTRAQDLEPLQNVLSISTAGKNRYLLHFNSLHSLTQWTAGIRLAMFEHASLQELYTGSLIAGKGKSLNNIRFIMERSRLKTEDWVRVRFGAGTPWRRCWCVISPPDEKEYQRMQKQMKKKSAYDRSVPVLKGNIQFYDGKRTKKVQPIATINDAYSAYAIYPQSKPLIDQSTLVKVEGSVTIHSTPPSTTEGFVFVMPEVHPAVTGFEMMLRWLFPVFDTFALYGRPNKLIADTLDARGLMFAMPKDRRYGYLEILDVAGLIHTDGSQRWREAEWRKKMKDITAKRITTMTSRGSRRSRAGSRAPARNSLNLPTRGSTVQFDDAASNHSSSSRPDHDPSAYGPPPKTHTAPANGTPFTPPHHQRSVSEAQGIDRYHGIDSDSADVGPPPPRHGGALGVREDSSPAGPSGAVHELPHDRSSSDSDPPTRSRNPMMASSQSLSLPEPVATPSTFARRSSASGLPKPYHSPELRRANSRMSTDTLSQLAGATGAGVTGMTAANAAAAAAWRASPDGSRRPGRPTAKTDPPSLPPVAVSSSPRDGTEAGSRWNAFSPNQSRSPLTPSSVLSDRPLPPTPYEAYRPPDAAPPVPAHQTPATPVDSAAGPTSRHPRRKESLAAAPFATTSGAGAGPVTAPEPSPTQNMTPRSDASATMGDALDSRGRPASGGESSSSRAPQPPRLRTSASITRKPLPDRSPSGRSLHSATPRSASSYGSLQNHAVDQTALDQVMAQSPAPSSGRGTQGLHRPSSRTSSQYDNESDGTPDYASTRQSTDTKRSAASVERPRAGVMRTVGSTDERPREVVVGDMRYQPDATPVSISADIPAIDFGPTLDLASPPLQRTQNGDTHRMSLSGRSRSSELIGRPPRSSPAPQDRPRPTMGRISPGSAYDLRTRARPQSQIYGPTGGDRPRISSAGSDPDVRRSIAWQPAMAVGVGGVNYPQRRSITPEQFVQQRAQQARVMPAYSHQRQASGESSPASASRIISGDFSGRPPSRGASAMVGTGDYAAHMSAREQEHVARATGSPLIPMGAGGGARHAPPTGGLVGAIEAREREKREIKDGLSGQMVQQAIMQRRQQEAQAYPSPQGYPNGAFSGHPPNVQPWSANQSYRPTGPGGAAYHPSDAQPQQAWGGAGY
ncbi:MAG: hypothetical protein M1838_004660 [Thelocarpon superellum]|nr:MAG: hypothetical protein M1838_004660 [Thelocarpon superellum]